MDPDIKERYKHVRDFIEHYYRHFNSAALKDASKGYISHLKKGGEMFVTLAGAMSTAELGIPLADMIRENKIHGISCTGANLEEDIFNLVAHDLYERIPNYRELSAKQEGELLEKRLHRVTDTCIPEEEAIIKIDNHLTKLWKEACEKGEKYFPHEYFYQLIKSGVLEKEYQIDPKNSWMVAACEKNLPIFVPGWEDSSIGNAFVGNWKLGKYPNMDMMKTGLDYMAELGDWYLEKTKKTPLGFFQIGGGIAGDFPICVVPHLKFDLFKDCKCWDYFCQISDSVTSYGGYSGAVPNEKITWGKLEVSTPKYLIESDATIVAPLMFAYVLAED
ncbi:deoxyhypusine synthase family protein [Nanoarchaeota archaeon]